MSAAQSNTPVARRESADRGYITAIGSLFVVSTAVRHLGGQKRADLRPERRKIDSDG
jgi:hypothetical protein